MQENFVALRKESVDRNHVAVHFDALSAVALRKESVDRNVNCNSNFTQKRHVALRKESVDRNTPAKNPMISVNSRSPQGERG